MISSDGIIFRVLPNVARMSKTFKNTIEENDEDITDFDLLCSKIPSQILSKVVEYCNYYQNDEKMIKIQTPFKGNELDSVLTQEWYANWAKNLNTDQMSGLLAAANFLNIPQLLDLMVLVWTTHIRGKSVEEMQQMFGVCTPETQATGEGDVEMKEGC